MIEEANKTMIGDETKNLLRESSTWMKAYSIILLVIISICFIFLLWALANSDEVYKMLGGQVEDAKATDRIKGFLLISLMIISGFGYSLTKLLMAGNNFYTISYSFKKTEVNKAFKNLRLFWMVSGFTMIILTIYAFFILF